MQFRNGRKIRRHRPAIASIFLFAASTLGATDLPENFPADRLKATTDLVPPATATELSEAASPLITRSFKLNSYAITGRLSGGLADQPALIVKNDERTENPDIQQALRDLLTAAGVKIPSEAGATFFYNDRTGTLLVRATAEELAQIQELIQSWESTLAQVRVEMRIAEIANLPQFQSLLDSLPGAAKTPPATAFTQSLTTLPVSILTAPQTAVLLRALEQREGVDLMSAPPVVTVSGRNARLQLENEEPVFDPPFHAPQPNRD